MTVFYLPDVVIDIDPNGNKQEMEDAVAYCAELSKLPCYSGDEIPPDPFPDTDDPEEDEMPADLTDEEVKELLKILGTYTISKADLESAAKDVKNKMPKERPLDVSPLGTGKNWVTEVGGLPLYVRAIAHAIMRRGTPKGEAIAIAIGAAKRFLASRHTTAQTKARSGTALAQWEAMRAASRAKTGVKDVVNTAEDADKEVKKSGEVDREEFLRNLSKDFELRGEAHGRPIELEHNDNPVRAFEKMGRDAQLDHMKFEHGQYAIPRVRSDRVELHALHHASKTFFEPYSDEHQAFPTVHEHKELI